MRHSRHSLDAIQLRKLSCHVVLKIASHFQMWSTSEYLNTSEWLMTKQQKNWVTQIRVCICGNLEISLVPEPGNWWCFLVIFYEPKTSHPYNSVRMAGRCSQPMGRILNAIHRNGLLIRFFTWPFALLFPRKTFSIKGKQLLRVENIFLSISRDIGNGSPVWLWS